MVEMEETLDDLFGDPGGLELSLTAAVPAKALPARIDELRILGCCQKIAWSKMGAIAYIAPDGSKAFLRNLSCSPEDGKWSLSDGDPEHPIAEAQGGHTLVHLSWNEPGIDLAIVDSCGRISVIGMSIGLNVLIQSRPAALDPDDDGNQPVGLMWLSMNRSVHTFSHAGRANGRWAYVRYPRRPMGPIHPLHKLALLVVTRSGKLRLLYQNQESKWGDMVVELHNTGYTDDVLTHASMTPVDGGGIMIVTHSTSNELRLYRAQLKWEGAPVDPNHQRPNNSIAIPSIQLVHIEVEVPHVVPSPSTYVTGDPENITNNANGLFALTHLQIIACPVDAPGGQTAPMILAVFSCPIHNAHGRSHLQHPTVLARWEFRTVNQNLHRSFDSIVSKQACQPLLPSTELKRQEDIYFERHVISIDYMEAGNILTITTEDGNIAFYDAKSFTPLSGPNDVETVTSLPQSGFTFPAAISPGVHISFSPSGCIAASLDEKSQVQIRIMEHSFGTEEDGLFNDGKFMSALAALTMAYCRACSSDSNNDDILMIVIQQLNPDSHKKFINEVYRALSMNVDFTVDQDKLMNNPYILKCFSMQAALGFKNQLERRSLPAAIPWLTLQLRQISILLTYYFHLNKANTEVECHDPEVLSITLGNVKWALDLAKYLVDDLFEISDNFNSQTGSQESGSSSGKPYESLSLILIISSIPRSFLKYICRGLRGLTNGFRNATNLSNESYQMYSQIVTVIAESALKVDVYEKLLAYVDNDIKHAYQNAGFTNADRAAPERDLLINGSIPPVLQPAVTSILTKTMPMIRNEANPMYLFLQDYSWLGVGDDKRSDIFRQKYELDILRKVLIPLDESRGAARPSRRCVRCCGVSEDVPPKSVAAVRMLMRTVVLRACTCGGMWSMSNANSLRGTTLPGWRQAG
ncbi:Mediator of RNA polymerase II transcription subunit 16 [Microsporum canis]